MKKTLRKLISILLVAGSVLLLTACGNSGKEQETDIQSQKEETAEATEDDFVKLTMYYPVNIGGSAANLIDEICSDFNETHENIYVEPVYTGNYEDTVIALEKAKKSDEMPKLFISLANQRYICLLFKWT